MILCKLLTTASYVVGLSIFTIPKWLLFIETDSLVKRSLAVVLKPQISTYGLPSLIGTSEWWLKSMAMKFR